MTKTNDPTTPETPEKMADANNVVPLNNAGSATPGASEKIVGFVKKHPVLTVAGGLAAGVAVSALLPRKAGRRLVGRAVSLAEAAGAASMMLGRGTSEKAHDLGLSAKRKASEMTSQVEDASEATAARLEKFGLAAIAAASALGRATAKRAELIGDAAADKGHKIVDIAGGLKHRIKR